MKGYEFVKERGNRIYVLILLYTTCQALFGV